MAGTDIKIGVALSGGSAWGVAHVGVLAALLKHGIAVDCIAGTSAGAVVAAPFAFGVPIETIEEGAKKIEWKQVARFAYSRLGIRTNAALAKLIRELLGDADIKDAKIPLAIVATDIEKGEEKIFREGDVAEAVRASSAIPGYFSPVDIDGTLYVDGGISENLPLSPLKAMGADFTIGINLAGPMDPGRPKNLGQVVARSFEVLYRSRDRLLVSNADILIEPNVASFRPRTFDEAGELYDEGFRAGEAAVPAIKMKLALLKAARSNFWQRVKEFLTSDLRG
ncbi:MAG TPA: patatin-like phospholipase family protein [Candidatus Paceibacterota bacterium]|jgi:NTE family protein|nr:patatin-like phospholipase family protein [Candidatus Paceibacterota bacterium]